MRAIFAALVAAFSFASPAAAGHFLPHAQHLTVEAKVVYFKRSLHKDQTAIAWLESRRAPRTLERVSELGWYRHAYRWHHELYGRYRAKLAPPAPTLDSCTAVILSREGGMNPHSTNPYSGAYGGPQALPGSKMASAGNDWRDNIWTQIRWMVGYETARYGSPCGALAFWNGHGYY